MSLTVKRANKWRTQYNPLRGLTIQRAVSMLEQGERGEYADLTWTYRFIEKRDATLRGLLKLRTSAIKKLDWDIKTVDDSPAAQAQAEQLRAAYEKVQNLKAAVGYLALAEFRGFTHLEKRYENDNPANPVISLEFVPQWHWVREDTYAEWQYNADAASTNRGVPIEKQHFIIREVDSPIDEIGLICFLRKNLSQKDWDGFVETYGLPPLFVEMPPNTPPDKADEYQEMAEAVVGDMRGTLPNGAKIQTADAGTRGTNPFRDHLTYQDEQLVLAGTSGKLTMLTSPTGLGSGQGDAHADTFDELAQAEAAEISEIFQKQFDRQVLGLDQNATALAYFELAAKPQEDVSKVLDDAGKASLAGFQVDVAQLAEKTGYKLTVKPAAAPTVPFGFNRAQTRNTASPLAEASRQKVAAALAAQLEPVRKRIKAAMEAGDDDTMRTALTELKASLPKEAAKLGADSELVKAFEDAMGTALVEGAATAAENTSVRNRAGIGAWLRSLFSRS